MSNILSATPNRQRGAALIISLIMLTVLTLVTLSGMQSTTLQEKMSFNLQDRNKAMQAADSGIRYAWSVLGGPGYTIDNFINNANESGLYDLRSEFTVSGNRLISDWNAIRGSSKWPWDETDLRHETLYKISASDPMDLATKPQFAMGMHAPVLRKGSEGMKCLPYSIIGAGQGSNSVTQVLVQISVLPKSGCFREIVK